MIGISTISMIIWHHSLSIVMKFRPILFLKNGTNLLRMNGRRPKSAKDLFANPFRLAPFRLYFAATSSSIKWWSTLDTRLQGLLPPNRRKKVYWKRQDIEIKNSKIIFKYLQYKRGEWGYLAVAFFKHTKIR